MGGEVAAPKTSHPSGSEVAMHQVGLYMTRDVVTLNEDDDLALADTIVGLGRIRHLPVVRQGKLVGLVTHRDILRACGPTRGPAASAVLAGEVMTRDLTTVKEGDSLGAAAKLMLRNKFGCLPVVESDGRLVGIITEADLVRFAVHVLRDLDRLDDLMVAEPIARG